jgi:hypothetical protein
VDIATSLDRLGKVLEGTEEAEEYDHVDALSMLKACIEIPSAWDADACKAMLEILTTEQLSISKLGVGWEIVQLPLVLLFFSHRKNDRAPDGLEAASLFRVLETYETYPMHIELVLEAVAGFLIYEGNGINTDTWLLLGELLVAATTAAAAAVSAAANAAAPGAVVTPATPALASASASVGPFTAATSVPYSYTSTLKLLDRVVTTLVRRLVTAPVSFYVTKKAVIAVLHVVHLLKRVDLLPAIFSHLRTATKPGPYAHLGPSHPQTLPLYPAIQVIHCLCTLCMCLCVSVLLLHCHCYHLTYIAPLHPGPCSCCGGTARLRPHCLRAAPSGLCVC